MNEGDEVNDGNEKNVKRMKLIMRSDWIVSVSM